jgi:uncharacterized Zn-binding protein involved in type VI secretion
MPPAARVGETTTHGGTVVGPGAATVLLGNMPAAVATDNHVCALPPDTHPLTSSIFPSGSATVFIEGKPALRTTDTCLCGAMVAIGDPTVLIG